MTALAMFMASTSGYVSRHEGVSLGWMAGAVAGTAAFFGMADPAAATSCPGSWIDCGTFCTSTVCDGDDFERNRFCKPDEGSSCVDFGFDHCSTTC